MSFVGRKRGAGGNCQAMEGAAPHDAGGQSADGAHKKSPGTDSTQPGYIYNTIYLIQDV